MDNFRDLKCLMVLKYFEEISKIPRGSGNEKQISDFIVNFAKERNLWVHQDDALNVIIKKPASKGFETAPTIIIQGHMDMVCEKNKDTVHDFEKDPIKLIYDGDFIKADGTTLGGDNGVAVAMGLALLDSNEISHPSLEVVFTTDEEVGMCGASALDGNLFDGRILLNIDSEEEGIFTAGCAGGMKTHSHIPIKYEKQDGNFVSYSVMINGLKGGHSGIDIDKNRANSNVILARILYRLFQKFDVRLNYISGGTKDNAIPREAEAVISFDEQLLKDINVFISENLDELKNEFKDSDSSINVKLDKMDRKEMCFSKDSAEKAVFVSMALPCGILTMSSDVNGLVESSNNLGVVKTNENEVTYVCAVRSSVISKKYFIFDKIKAITEAAGGNLTYIGDYPAWEYNKDSRIRKLCVSEFEKMFHKKAKEEIVHAGLECGIFAKKINGIDMISFGPNLYDIHTPDEKASISSIERCWLFLLNILEKLKD